MGKALKNWLESSTEIEKFMEHGREIEVSDFGFRSTFDEGSVMPFHGLIGPCNGSIRALQEFGGGFSKGCLRAL